MSRRYAVAAWMLALGPSGASHRLLALLHALPALLADDERLVVLHRDASPCPGHPRVEFVRVALPARPAWRRALAERWRLRRLLAALQVDLLHLETLPVPPRLPCKVVLTIHDLRDLGPFARRCRGLFRHTLNTSSTRAQALVTPSAFTARELGAVLGRTDVTVVPGVLTADWAHARVGASPFPGAFVHVGHLEPRKDLDTLLAAYAQARARAGELPPLVLAGRDGGSLDRLRRRVRGSGLDRSVHFTGDVDAATLHALYRDARAVLVPSRYEGFGMPALEALAHGTRVVVSDAGALPEVVGEVGRIVPAGDVAAWANVLVELARSEPDLEHAALRRARAAHFSADPAARTLLEVWRRVAASA